MPGRRANSEALGLIDKAVHLPFDPTQTDDFAEEAERTFGRKYGIEDQVRTDGPDAGWDFTIGESRIDIKWTPRTNGALLKRIDRKPKWADYYVLVVGMPPMKIVGWATREMVAKSKGDLGYGPTHLIPQNKLNVDVDGLVIALRKKRGAKIPK